MKTYIYLLITVLLLSCLKDKSSIERLDDVVNAIDNIPVFEYTAYYDINQEGNKIADTTKVYIEKSEEAGLLPMKYVFESTTGDLQFFDGRIINNVMNSERSILRMENPPSFQIVSNQGLIFSPIYVRNLLDYLLNNDKESIVHVKDSSQDGIATKVYEINIDYIYLLNGDIVKNGELLPNEIVADNINKKFEIVINAETNFPISLKEVYSENDYIKVSFSPINISDTTFEERAKLLNNDAYLKLSMDDYMQIQISKQMEIIGSQAKNFKLQLFPENEVKLSDYAGDPLLLEFWFPGCGFCAKAVPDVNKISNKYKSKGLNVIGIEMSNASVERIRKYVFDNNVEIPVLMNGKELSLEYSVNSGPTFILLNKNHKVVYRGSGLNYQELTNELDKVI